MITRTVVFNAGCQRNEAHSTGETAQVSVVVHTDPYCQRHVITLFCQTHLRVHVPTDVGAAGSLGGTWRWKRSHCLCLSFIQDRSAVCVCCQPEPELSGEEHTETGQQQHEGPAHLR